MSPRSGSVDPPCEGLGSSSWPSGPSCGGAQEVPNGATVDAMGRESTLQRFGRARAGPFTVLELAPTLILVPLALVETLGGRAETLLGPPAGVALFLVVAGVALLW